jgi:hypothetical protein
VLTRAPRFKHEAHQATSRGTFEVFQKSGFLMFLGAGMRAVYLPRFMAGGGRNPLGARALSRQHPLANPRHQSATPVAFVAEDHLARFVVSLLRYLIPKVVTIRLSS